MDLSYVSGYERPRTSGGPIPPNEMIYYVNSHANRVSYMRFIDRKIWTKTRTRLKKKWFAKSGQIRKAIKPERDSLSHNKFNVESLLPVFLRCQQIENSREKVVTLFFIYLFCPTIPDPLWHRSAYHLWNIKAIGQVVENARNIVVPLVETLIHPYETYFQVRKIHYTFGDVRLTKLCDFHSATGIWNAKVKSV